MKPVVVCGGYCSYPFIYIGLKRLLSRPPFNCDVFIVPLYPIDWKLAPKFHYKNILSKIQKTVDLALSRNKDSMITLICNSMSSLLGRLFLSDKPFYETVYDGKSKIDTLIGLGPVNHNKFQPYVDNNYPGAYFDEVKYIVVTSKAVKGNKDGDRFEKRAFNKYSQLTGNGELHGDGFVSIDSSILDGAENIILSNIYHSPLRQPWYGSKIALQYWGTYLLNK